MGKINKDLETGKTLLKDQVEIVGILEEGFIGLGEKISNAFSNMQDSLEGNLDLSEKLAKSLERNITGSIKKMGDGLEDNIKFKVQKIILNEKNYGKGFSLRKGIAAATGDIILIQDADLEYDPTDYQKLIDPIKKGHADVVYGSRFIGSEEKRVLFFWHMLGNKLLTILSNIFTNFW